MGNWQGSVRVLAFDPVNVGYSHAMFNAAVVRALDAVSIVGRVEVLLAGSSLESKALADVLALGKVRVEATLPERRNPTGRVREAQRAVGCHIHLCRALWRKRDMACIHLASDNLIGPVCLLIDRLVRSGEAMVILHNNAHGIQRSKAVRRLWGGVFRSGVKAVVLAQTVYDFYRERYPDVEFEFLRHPSYGDASGLTEGRQSPRGGRRFLLLGRHGRSAGTVEFLRRFIEACAAVGSGEQVTICVERSVGRQVEPVAGKAGIVLEMYDWPVGHDEYYGMVRAAHFVVFPPEGSERITASGVQADALSCCVPIIAPAQGVFRENVAESGLPLLYRDAAADLRRVVARATTLSRAEHERLRSDLDEIRRDCDVIRTAQRLASLVGAASG